jgi:hypothetical protein
LALSSVRMLRRRAVNETVLALLCSIAIYAVSSLALPHSEIDAPADVADVSNELDDSRIGDDGSEPRNNPAEVG